MSEIVIRVDDQETLPRSVWCVLVKIRAGFLCEECDKQLDKIANSGERGHKPNAPHAHHKNHDGSDHRLSNGECVCLSCHGKLTSSTSSFKSAVASGNKRFKKQKSPSDEVKIRISESLKGRVLSDEHKAKISASLKGKKKNVRVYPFT